MTAVDLAAAERAVTDLLLAIGEDPTSPELQQTPGRVAHALAGLLAPPDDPVAAYTPVDTYDELVVVRDLAFWSVCADHLSPFGGVVHVAYGPGPIATGATHVAHVVDRCARRLQTPSRLPVGIAAELERDLTPVALGVAVEITRPCPVPIGDEVPATARTAAFRGELRDDPHGRAEFVRLTSTARADR